MEWWIWLLIALAIVVVVVVIIVIIRKFGRSSLGRPQFSQPPIPAPPTSPPPPAPESPPQLRYRERRRALFRDYLNPYALTRFQTKVYDNLTKKDIDEIKRIDKDLVDSSFAEYLDFGDVTFTFPNQELLLDRIRQSPNISEHAKQYLGQVLTERVQRSSQSHLK